MPGGALADYGMKAFESKLQRALERVRLVLESEKATCLPTELHHQYEDKYLLAEFLTNTAAASQLNCLSHLGLGAEQLNKLREWAQTSAVSLRLRGEETCTFLREESRDVEDPKRRVEEFSVAGVAQSAWNSKVVTKVTEYFWRLDVKYELLAFRGVGAQPDDQLQLLARTGSDELKTAAKTSPRPEKLIPAANHEVEITWLLRQLPAGAVNLAFKVERAGAGCRTPRRNPEVEAASAHFAKFERWARASFGYLEGLLGVQPDPTRKLDLDTVRRLPPCVSVVPLLLRGGQAAAAPPAGGAAAAAGTLACLGSSGGQLMAPEDANRLLAEESRALQERRQEVLSAYPASGAVATSAEGVIVVVLRHCVEVCGQWSGGLDYLEGLLRQQLIAAIGKEVSPADFAEYMRFHNRKLFGEGFVPVPFCFAVRRSDEHAPEGTVSIEQSNMVDGNSMAAPIVTIVAKGAAPHPMQFPLSASTTVRYGGERYLHAWLNHKFSGDAGAPLKFVARARQFSSMLVLVGRIASATVFEPKHAAIIQNKDELTIPLELSTIPTPKEFKDAVESLSPEMRSFAKAFRAMQLESTLFGVLVIHIKPQLERVLNLAPDSLTKEIKLTQDLMQLFIKYQIPGDLLSFDASAAVEGVEMVGATPAERLAAVKGHVQAMHEMIEKAKNEELHDRRMEAAFDRPHLRMEEELFCGAAAECFEEMECCEEMRCCEQEEEEEDMDFDLFDGAPAVCRSAPPPPPSAAAPAMQQQQQQSQPSSAQPARPAQPQQPQQAEGGAVGGAGPAMDYTKVPKELDRKFEELDSDSSLRPTIINVGESWEKKAQKALLAKPETKHLGTDEQKEEKDAAFDLLDALTKSGALPVEHAALHVVIAATHCFDKTVTETVVQDNVNPIDKVERSTLIMATTVHQKPAAALIQQSQHARVSGTSPMLFLEDSL